MTTPIYVFNKYYTLYHNIISLAISQNRYKSKEQYYENHHITPKSFGGSNKPDNLVFLTAREHYICHYLLIKFTTSDHKRKMVYGFNMMGISSSNQTRYINSKLFESNKIKFIDQVSKTHKNKIISNETKHKMSIAQKGSLNHNYNKTTPLDVKNKISISLSNKNHWNYGKMTSTYTKRKMSKSHIGINKNENHFTFVGYYVTPWGKYTSKSNAINELIKSKDTIGIYCKNSDKIITKMNVSCSKYLQSLKESPLGKTFKDIGFSFQPK